jgi:predicted nuclease with TOPRIM domain
LTKELSAVRDDYTNQFNQHKAYTEQLQRACIGLEERIDKANSDIMKLTMERDKLDKDREKYLELYNQLKGKESDLAEEAERKVLELKGELIKQEVVPFSRSGSFKYDWTKQNRICLPGKMIMKL